MNCILMRVFIVLFLLSVFHKKWPIGHHLHMSTCSSSSSSIIFRRHSKWCISKCATRCMAMDIKHLFIRLTKKVQYETVTYSSEREHKMRKFINILSMDALSVCCCFFLLFYLFIYLAFASQVGYYDYYDYYMSILFAHIRLRAH